MTNLKRAIGLAEILHSDLQLSKAEQNEAGVMLRELATELEILRKQEPVNQQLLDALKAMEAEFNYGDVNDGEWLALKKARYAIEDAEKEQNGPR